MPRSGSPTSIEISVDWRKTESAFAGARGNRSCGASIGSTRRIIADAAETKIEVAATRAPRKRVLAFGEESALLICGAARRSEITPETAAVNTASENRCALKALKA
eukprot:Amastigsp_a178160_11.p3 type:complete len:106 gc:universal Amastigsp_a178160_11:421-104(-)